MDDDIVGQIEQQALEGATQQLDPKKAPAFGRRDFVMDLIALVVIFGFFGMAFLIALTPRDNTDHDVLNMLIGQLSAGFIAVLSFFFGNVRKP